MPGCPGRRQVIAALRRTCWDDLLDRRRRAAAGSVHGGLGSETVDVDEAVVGGCLRRGDDVGAAIEVIIDVAEAVSTRRVQGVGEDLARQERRQYWTAA